MHRQHVEMLSAKNFNNVGICCGNYKLVSCFSQLAGRFFNNFHVAVERTKYEALELVQVFRGNGGLPAENRCMVTDEANKVE